MQPNTNPYDFLNQPPSQKRPLIGAADQKTRIIQVVIAVVILLIIAVVVINIIGSVGGATKQQYLEVAAAQSDIIDITDKGAQSAKNSSLITTALLLNMTTKTQSQDTLETLGSYGIGKNPEKQLASYRDTSYTQKLEAAEQNNTYDDAYQTVLANALGTYRAKLQNAYNGVKDSNEKQKLAEYYNQIELIVPTKE
jgi:hypothetical protein